MVRRFQQHRALWNDRLYDFRHSVDTAWEIPVSFLGLPEDAARDSSNYGVSREAPFHRAIASLPIQYADFTFIDVGAGMGKSVFMATDYPFRRVIGVELSRAMMEVAERNLQRYHSRARKCWNVELVLADAATYVFPAERSVYYFHDPFGAPATRRVAGSILKSMEECPRDNYIVAAHYESATVDRTWDEFPWLTLVADRADCQIYRTRSNSS